MEKALYKCTTLLFTFLLFRWSAVWTVQHLANNTSDTKIFAIVLRRCVQFYLKIYGILSFITFKSKCTITKQATSRISDSQAFKFSWKSHMNLRGKQTQHKLQHHMYSMSNRLLEAWQISAIQKIIYEIVDLYLFVLLHLWHFEMKKSITMITLLQCINVNKDVSRTCSWRHNLTASETINTAV